MCVKTDPLENNGSLNFDHKRKQTVQASNTFCCVTSLYKLFLHPYWRHRYKNAWEFVCCFHCFYFKETGMDVMSRTAAGTMLFYPGLIFYLGFIDVLLLVCLIVTYTLIWLFIIFIIKGIIKFFINNMEVARFVLLLLSKTPLARVCNIFKAGIRSLLTQMC